MHFFLPDVFPTYASAEYLAEPNPVGHKDIYRVGEQVDKYSRYVFWSSYFKS